MKFSIRVAESNDIPLLTDHHRKMFQDILSSQGIDSDNRNMDKMDEEYQNKLNGELGTECGAWIVKDAGKPVASGAVSIISMVPTPYDHSYKVALLHSLFTENEYRGNGIAGQILEHVVKYCKSRGIKRLLLNASDKGIPLYKKFGFEPVGNSMRLWIE